MNEMLQLAQQSVSTNRILRLTASTALLTE